MTVILQKEANAAQHMASAPQRVANSVQQELMAIMQQAAELEASGQFGMAESAYRNIATRYPRFDPAWHALGLLAYRGGQLEVAAQYIAQAIAHNGDIALYHRNYGELCRRLGHFDTAIVAGRRAITLAPDDAEAHYNLALALADSDLLQEAVSYYREVLTHNPEHGLAWNNLGAALERLGDMKAAEDAYAHAVEINAKHVEAQNNLGAIYTLQGKLPAAINCFNAAIRARPSFVEAHCNLSSLKRYTEDDAHVLVLEALSATFESASVDDKIRLNFALGKARDDLGDYANAFKAYALANALKYSQCPYDESCADATLDAFLRTFDKNYFDVSQPLIEADVNRVPIFIIGMPRSGTTLLEQILASHSAIYGAGELPTLNQVITDKIEVRIGPSLAQRAAALSDNEGYDIGAKYVQQVWQHAPTARYIVDKMPANFFWTGMIHRLFPHAKIIHTLRDPMDVGLSCFTRVFDNPSMAFTYDQGVLGRYYLRYAALMQHWRDVLPPASILDVRYEEVVADPETQVRRMLDFIGVQWDAATMNFHMNQRPVKTASLAQVRKPIYAGSIGRWQCFSQQLEPLFKLVAPLREGFYR